MAARPKSPLSAEAQIEQQLREELKEPLGKIPLYTRIAKLRARQKAGQKLSAAEEAEIAQFLDPNPDTPHEPRPASYDSIASAAAALGVSKSTLRKAKRDGAPGFRGSRVYPADLLPWLDAQSKTETPKAQLDKDELERQWLEERHRKEKFLNDQREGRYISKAETLAQLSDLGALQKATLRTALEDDLPPVIQNQPAAAIRVHMKELVDRLCRQFQEILK